MPESNAILRISLQRPFSLVVISFGFLLVAVLFISSTFGAVGTSFTDMVQFLLASVGVGNVEGLAPVQIVVLETIRIPRMILTLLVGASLGVSGAALQGLFRNPLADPALIGVSSGAAFFASIAIVFEASLASYSLISLFGAYVLPVAAFMGSLLVSLAVLKLASVGGETDISTMLLAGIAINAITQAGTGLITYLSDDTQLRTLTFWLMGSLSGAEWEQLMVVGPFVIVGVLVIMSQANALNAIMLGESVAGHLGFSTQVVKLLIIVSVSISVGASVALTGVIGFVGLVVPHMVRLIVGPNHNHTFILSAMFGAVVLLLADLVSRTIVSPAELPIGIVTSIFGGPFFLWLLMRNNAMRGRA